LLLVGGFFRNANDNAVDPNSSPDADALQWVDEAFRLNPTHHATTMALLQDPDTQMVGAMYFSVKAFHLNSTWTSDSDGKMVALYQLLL